MLRNLAAAHKFHDFKLGVRGDDRRRPVAFPHDSSVQLNCDTLRRNLQVVEERSERLITRNLPGRSVDPNLN
jgi:hypothetical protein